MDILELDGAMKRGRHPNVIRAWPAGKIQKQVVRALGLIAVSRKLQPHNKT